MSDGSTANTTTPEITDVVEDLVHRCEDVEKTADRAVIAAELADVVEHLDSTDQARVLDRLDAVDRQIVFDALPPDQAADVVEHLSNEQAATVIRDLTPESAAEVCGQMRSEDRADVLGDLSPDVAEAVLANMSTEDAEAVRSLTQYADDVAGGLMATEFLTVSARSSVGEVIDHLTSGADRYRDYDVQYVYVTDEAERLVGVLPLRELVLRRRATPVADVMIGKPLALPASTSLDELDEFFETHAFFGVPAVDDAGKLVGVVRRSSVVEALADRADDNYRKSQGLVAEELRSMPVIVRSRRRLAWLSINIVLNAIAASVIIAFESTLQQVIALAVFLPIISDMSGCSGGQAVAVTMRELSLGLARPSDFLRVWLKEASVGIINGICLGLLLGVGALIMYGNPWLGLVVGVALGVNTLVAVSIGGCVPLVLKRFGFDPAVASGPLLTTVTDMCGFFIVLVLATALLPHLIS